MVTPPPVVLRGRPTEERPPVRDFLVVLGFVVVVVVVSVKGLRGRELPVAWRVRAMVVCGGGNSVWFRLGFFMGWWLRWTGVLLGAWRELRECKLVFEVFY